MAKKANNDTEAPAPKLVVEFSATLDGKKVDFEIGSEDIPTFIVPGFGKMTAEDAVKSPEVISYLIENNCTIVTKKE